MKTTCNALLILGYCTVHLHIQNNKVKGLFVFPNTYPGHSRLTEPLCSHNHCVEQLFINEKY